VTSRCVSKVLFAFLRTYLFIYLITYFLTPRRRVLLDKLIASQVVKTFPAFYGARRFITAFTISSHLPLSWARSIQSIPLIRLPEHPSSCLCLDL